MFCANRCCSRLLYSSHVALFHLRFIVFFIVKLTFVSTCGPSCYCIIRGDFRLNAPMLASGFYAKRHALSIHLHVWFCATQKHTHLNLFLLSRCTFRARAIKLNLDWKVLKLRQSSLKEAWSVMKMSFMKRNYCRWIDAMMRRMEKIELAHVNKELLMEKLKRAEITSQKWNDSIERFTHKIGIFICCCWTEKFSVFFLLCKFSECTQQSVNVAMFFANILCVSAGVSMYCIHNFCVWQISDFFLLPCILLLEIRFAIGHFILSPYSNDVDETICHDWKSIENALKWALSGSMLVTIVDSYTLIFRFHCGCFGYVHVIVMKCWPFNMPKRFLFIFFSRLVGCVLESVGRMSRLFHICKRLQTVCRCK